jgi:hypothetical protein
MDLLSALFPCGLGFAQAEDQGEHAAGEKNDSDRRWKFFTAFGLNANFCVPELNAVILAVRNWHHESQDSQHQQQDTNQRKSFHRNSIIRVNIAL